MMQPRTLKGNLMNTRTDNGNGIAALESTTAHRHALVLGGSLAGLLAARVLCDHFDRVTVVERDSYPVTASPRRGVPQANHVHALMPRGRLILEQLFPGLQREMMAAGASLVAMGKDVAWLTPQGWGVRFKSGLEVLSFTRPLLDLHVRRRLLADYRLQVMDNTEIVRLLPGNQSERVSGALVRTRDKNSESIVEIGLRADLVVDATGRASRAPQWLEHLGYPAPEETIINAHLGYASRLYRIPEGFSADWKCVFVQAAPPERKRGAILFTVEGDRWLVTLIGGGRDYPPTDDVAFLEFARSLPVPVIYDAIRKAEPLSPIKGFRGTENRLRHFESAARQPENFIALGDSVCAFNPVYGQGMTIAAMGAMALHECLRNQKGTLKAFARRFQEQLAKVNAAPWMLATGEDYRYRETEGGSPNLVTRFTHRYMNQVVKLSTFDASVRRVLLEVFGMLVQPSALFRPNIVLRVLRITLGFARPPKTAARRASSSALAYDAAGND
jgi:2-polyprenyl-6-methoxyphenol hydroxylase-like FAD-dependent oxidoreductase